MTSEQLKAFPEDLRTEGVKNPEPFREKIEKTRQIFSARETETQEDFSGEWYRELSEDNEAYKEWGRESKAKFLREHKEIPGKPGCYRVQSF